MKKIYPLYILACFWACFSSSCQELTPTTDAKDKAPQNMEAHSDEKDSFIDAGVTIFSINAFENEKKEYEPFVSLSDIYYDSLAIPPEYLAQQKNLSFKKLRTFELTGEYRKRMLDATKYNETDTVFVYDFKQDRLTKFLVRNLKSVAYLTPYAYGKGELFEDDYMIGFQLPQKALQESAEEYYQSILVVIGSENPFLLHKMQPINWQKITPQAYTEVVGIEQYIIDPKLELFLYVQDSITLVIQENRSLLGINNKTKEILINTKFYRGEGGEFVPLHQANTEEQRGEVQWFGYLFQNKPPVVFNFVSHSFGCPAITFLNKKYKDLDIHCDNRH